MAEHLGDLKRTHTCGALRPDDVGKDVVVLGWVHRIRDLGGVTFLDIRDRAGVSQVVVRENDAVLDRWLTPEFRAADPEQAASLRAMIAGSPPEGYAACCGAIARMDLRGELGRVQAPTLVVSGEQDVATPVADQELIAGAVAGARHSVVSPAAHLAAVEQPERVNGLIAGFLG